MTGDTYTCAVCGNIYYKTRPESETLEEMEALWGKIPAEERAVVCDDCFNGRTPGTRSYKEVLSDLGVREQ